MLDILKLLFCAPFLIYSCYSDMKTRTVSNKVWKFMLAGAIPFLVYDIQASGIPYLWQILISTSIMFFIAYVLFFTGAFGGADAKALIVLSILFPVYPAFILHKPLLGLFSFSLLSNAVILAIIVPISLALYNVIKMGLSIDNPGYIFIGYQAKISELADKHVRLIQKFEIVKSTVKFHFKLGGIEIDDNIISELKELSDRGLIGDTVWVTPGLPFMIPITIGFFVTAFYGDIIFEIARYLMK